MSVYGASDHLDMMVDPRRVLAFRKAIAETVRPGDHVLDLGAGAGVMTFWALESGAAHVTAIETSANVSILHEAARRAGMTERVTILRADSRDITLRTRADVLIADIRGALPTYQDALAVLFDARTRHLRPGGTAIPLRDRLFIAPVGLPAHAARRRRWQMAAGSGDYAFMIGQSANEWERHEVDADALLGPASSLGVIDYALQPPKLVGGSVSVKPTRAATCHGLCVWWQADLTENVSLSSAPELGPSVYGQGLFPLEPGLEITPQAPLSLDWEVWPRLSEPMFRWRARTGTEAREHSTFHGASFSLADLQRRAPTSRPGLDERGRMRLHVLRTADEGLSLGEIAASLCTRWPERFADPAEALDYATRLTVP